MIASLTVAQPMTVSSSLRYPDPFHFVLQEYSVDRMEDVDCSLFER
jgi:hypothetical protein